MRKRLAEMDCDPISELALIGKNRKLPERYRLAALTVLANLGFEKPAQPSPDYTQQTKLIGLKTTDTHEDRIQKIMAAVSKGKLSNVEGGRLLDLNAKAVELLDLRSIETRLKSLEGRAGQRSEVVTLWSA